MALFVATASASDAMMRVVRQAVWSVDPARPVFDTRAMRRIVEDSYGVQRATLWVAGALAGLAVILMLGGTYAVVNLVTASRTTEIGVRLALGAGPRDILRAVLARPCAAAAAGMVVGMGGALAAARMLHTQMAGVPPLDARVGATVLAVVALAIGTACFAPARRAMQTDPAMALRGE
jgi:putative ABC transport system permease protein